MRIHALSSHRLIAAYFLAATTVPAQSATAQCNANVATYCTAGISTNGCVAAISGYGIPSSNAPSGFDIVVASVPGQRNGSLLYGFAPQATPFTPNSSSFRCVAAPFQRLGAANSGGAAGQCDGSLSTDFNHWLATHPSALGSPYAAGQAFFVQGWYRDPGAPGFGNLSNGLSFSLCGGSGAPPMFIDSCNLGCSGGSGGAQVSCGQLQTFLNQDIVVEFSEPIDPSTLSNASFRVINTSTGATALGSYLVDASDSTRAIFRPSLSFDVLGNPIFGLESNGGYQINLPGVAQGDAGPFVASTLGEPNSSRMLCTISANQGVMDYAPGSQPVSIYALVVGSSTPVEISGGGVVNVQTQSPLTFVYSDVMNLATVALPFNGMAPFVTVRLDVDGNLQTTADQVVIDGVHNASFDVDTATTTVVFTPAAGWPGPGTGTTPRRVVVDVPAAVQDLVGNSVSNYGVRSFVAQ